MAHWGNLGTFQKSPVWAYSPFLTRSRRRSGNKSKAAHAGGLLGNKLFAVRANLALFVLEEREPSVRGFSAAD